MTPERDIERVLESWLEPGASKMPDRLFDAIVDGIERVPQRRFVWTHTRFTAMTPMLKFAAVAALALVIGIGIAPLASNLNTQVSASPSPSPIATSLPVGSYSTAVNADDTAGLDFHDQCIDKPDLWQIQLLIRSGYRWNAQEVCPGLDPEVPYAQAGGTYTVSGDQLTMIDGSEAANQATFVWRSIDNGLALELLDVTQPDQAFAFRFMLSHDWVRAPEGLEETYVVDQPFPMRATFNVPTGWSATGELLGLSPGQFMLVKSINGRNVWWVGAYIVADVRTDTCHGIVASPPIGPSVDDLTKALTSMSGITAGPVADVTIGGFSGKAFDLDPSMATTGCTGDPFLEEWSTGSNWEGIAEGQHQRITILDVEGTRILLKRQTFPWTSIADEQEADRVLQSVHFDRLASPSP